MVDRGLAPDHKQLGTGSNLDTAIWFLQHVNVKLDILDFRSKWISSTGKKDYTYLVGEAQRIQKWLPTPNTIDRLNTDSPVVKPKSGTRNTHIHTELLITGSSLAL